MKYCTTPQVTIAMVTYNSEEYVKTAIESVLGNEYRNFELLIYDDCSTDSTWDIISQFTDARVKAFKNDKNMGEYSNRNQCISKAKGKYFIFVDGDDYMLKTGLREAIEELNKNSKFVMGIVRPAVENIQNPEFLTPYIAYKKHYFEKTPLNLSFARNIFSTRTLQELGGLPLGVFSGDDFIRLRIAAQYGCLLLPSPFAQWRKRPGQATDRKAESARGIAEPYLLNFYFLSQSYCPLNFFERRMAMLKLINGVLFQFLLLIKSRRFKDASEFLSLTKIIYSGILRSRSSFQIQ